MALKPVYDSRDAIPDGLADHYTEQSDGTFKIDLEGGIKTQADVDKAMKALRDERDAHKETKKALKDLPDDFDAEKWNKVKDLDPDNLPTGSEDVEALKAKHAEELRRIKSENEQKVSQTESRFKNTLKEQQLRDALLKNGVTNPIRLDDAVTRIMRHGDVEVISDDNDQFKVVVGALRDSATDFVKSWVTTDEGKYYVSAENNSGGGAHNSGSGGGKDVNPWAKETWNVTKQGQIYKSDPAKAARLAKAAGKEVRVAS